jgi:ABC-type transport system involved in multi-copper enzyme maturation permease subunit
MVFTSIFTRELRAVVRRGCVQWDRSFVATSLLAIMAGTLAVRCYWADGIVSNHLIARVGQQAFGFAAAFHALWIISVPALAARCIALEKDRRTLDFLLTTRLSNAEIVLGKLAAFLVVSLTTLGAGLPIMVLLVVVGGVDYRLILIVYACVVSMAFFLAALSIWASTAATDVRGATNLAVLYTMGWAMGPMVVAFALPRFGIHLPWWALAANAWLMASSPVGLLLSIGGTAAGLLAAVGWMIGLQAIGGVLLLIWSIARLRSAYRVGAGGDGRVLGRVRRRPVWRFRPRPAVGDDPILWKEMYTTRASGLAKVFGFLLNFGILATLAFGTYYFARPAVIEVWNHGYSSGQTTDKPPEMNLFIRLFVSGGGFNLPVDLARTEFNLFLRYITGMIAFCIAVFAMAVAAEMVATERARETWPGLLATPLAARDIARAQMLVGVWRLRGLIAVLLVLWTTGLFAGAIHPVGYVVTLLELAVSTWALLAFGVVASLRSKNLAAMLPIIAMTLIGASVLPFLLPGRFSSVLLGAGSAPFVEWLSLLSYRDVRAGVHYAAYPPFQWMGITTGEGRLRAVMTCLIGIVAPALGGLFAWRYFHAHFDRLVGRPWRAPTMDVKRTVAQPNAVVLQAHAG